MRNMQISDNKQQKKVKWENFKNQLLATKVLNKSFFKIQNKTVLVSCCFCPGWKVYKQKRINTKQHANTDTHTQSDSFQSARKHLSVLRYNVNTPPDFPPPSSHQYMRTKETSVILHAHTHPRTRREI